MGLEIIELYKKKTRQKTKKERKKEALARTATGDV